jgi:hypothetical protein
MKTYTRSELTALQPTQDHSLRYWRNQAKRVLDRHPEVELVEIINSGRKTDCRWLPTGVQYPPNGIYVIIASTGGRWGKSRKDYHPLNFITYKL